MPAGLRPAGWGPAGPSRAGLRNSKITAGLRWPAGHRPRQSRYATRRPSPLALKNSETLHANRMRYEEARDTVLSGISAKEV